VAECGGGVHELVVASLDSVDRTGVYVVHDLRERVPELVYQH
jgi:hypothetical protein